MPNRTDHTTGNGLAPHDDSTWRRTTTARAFIALAGRLAQLATRQHPLGGTWQPCMTSGYLATLTPSIIGSLLPAVPYDHRALVGPLVEQALPPVDGTIAEYAARLRTLAVTQ
ncbi:hypothetical protein ABTX35_25500 [Streptomyces sp. NPDC096080]|uniref:hypothetical protein n=1 Tax=Streptomyces sp. NPDC096080 TaxID=3156693 RepID=UPI003330971C